MNEWDGQERRENRPEQKGFMVRYELLGIISLMVVHLIGASWWASSMATDVKYMRLDILKMTVQLENINNNSYTNLDAKKDFAVVEERMVRDEARITALENRIGK